MSYWIGVGLILAAGLGLLVVLVYAVRTRWPDPQSKTRERLQNLLVLLFSLFITVIGLELYMKVIFAQTDDFGHTLAFKNWYERYWGQTNSLGYRDREWTWDDVAGKHKIMVDFV